MIPAQNIVAWGNVVPWADQRQVEQDLIISRALVEIFSDDMLRNAVRFRGGTALNKLHFPKPMRLRGYRPGPDWGVLSEFFAWLQTGVAPAMPATYRMAAGEIVLRDPTLRLPVSGRAQSYLEIIRFAAANRLCVDLEYGGLSGGSNRTPYGAPVTATSSCTPQGPPMVSIGATVSTAYKARGQPGGVSFLDSR